MAERIGDWLCTFTGTSFYPLDARPDEVHIEDIAHALSNLCRFGGHCREFYSVAEHSVRVMDAVILWTGGTKPGAVLAALLHDASEAYLIDVPRPLKRYLRDYGPIEHALSDVVFDRFDVSHEYRHHPLIKVADNVLLATEKRDLMPSRSAEWAPLPEPLATTISPWSPTVAKSNFLAAFDRAHEGSRRN